MAGVLCPIRAYLFNLPRLVLAVCGRARVQGFLGHAVPEVVALDTAYRNLLGRNAAIYPAGAGGLGLDLIKGGLLVNDATLDLDAHTVMGDVRHNGRAGSDTTRKGE